MLSITLSQWTKRKTSYFLFHTFFLKKSGAYIIHSATQPLTAESEIWFYIRSGKYSLKLFFIFKYVVYRIHVHLNTTGNCGSCSPKHQKVCPPHYSSHGQSSKFMNVLLDKTGWGFCALELVSCTVNAD